MIYIPKNSSPAKFEDWKNRNPNKGYCDLKVTMKKRLRDSILSEQGYICCFCGCALGVLSPDGSRYLQQPVTRKSKHNVRLAHIVPRSIDHTKELDYTNICASCDSTKSCFRKTTNPARVHQTNDSHCDVAQANNALPINPTMQDCLEYFSFGIDGTIAPNQQKSQIEQGNAQKTIDILGLDCHILQVQRKNILKNLQTNISDKASLLQRLRKISKKNRKGYFAPFYFVALSYYSNLKDEL